MAVNHAVRGLRRQRQLASCCAHLLGQPIVGERSRGRDLARFWTRHEVWPFIDQRQKTAWLQTQDGPPFRNALGPLWRLGRDQASSFFEVAFADQRPSAASETGELDFVARVLQYSHRRPTDRRLVVSCKAIVEQD